MQSINNGWSWTAIMLTIAMLAGCETTAIRTSGRARPLTGTEMDQVSAGSASAMSNVDASALGSAPQTATSGSTLASSGNLVSALPFLGYLTLNYANSQAAASASNALLTEANGSIDVAVDGGGGGASINAASSAIAAGSGTSHAQINMQFYGISIGRGVDLVFGSAVATACCAPILGAQSTADGVGGGYWRKLQASSVSVAPGQVQSRVDISVVSSALPNLDAGLVSALIAPTLSQSIGQ